MVKASDELDNYIVMNSYDEDEAEEMALYLYCAVRLKPLIGHAGINVNRADNIASFLVNNYLQDDLSLDLMINAVYNYINSTRTCPSDTLLSDNIETLLEDYALVEEE